MTENTLFLRQDEADRGHCTFARISASYSGDLATQIGPCFYGGKPDCAHCGCAVSGGLRRLHETPIFGPMKVGHLIEGTLLTGRVWDGARRTILHTRDNLLAKRQHFSSHPDHSPNRSALT